MRQQLSDLVVFLRGQAREHVLHIGIWVVPIEPCRLDQAHDGGRALAPAQRAREQPVRTPDRPGADLVLHPIVVDQRITVVKVACQRLPALEAVVDGARGAGAFRHTLALRCPAPRGKYEIDVESVHKGTAMKKRFTEEQIIGVLKEAEAGAKVAKLCRKHGISEATYYNWKAKFGGMTVSDAQRLKELEQENNKLKKLLAESMLDKAALQDLLSRK